MNAPALLAPDPILPQDDETDPVAWSGDERRSPDPVRRLSRTFNELCTGAVDAAEITAGLEMAGFTDGTAKRYGFDDVFGLAEELFALTPRLVNRRAGRLANPWVENAGEHLLRGVAFAAPGLLFVACLPQSDRVVDRAALIGSLLVGWPLGQSMAFAGHLLIGRRHRGAAKVALAVGVSIAVLFAGAGFVVLSRLGVRPGIVGLAIGQMLYLAASAALIVLGRVWMVFAVLSPGLIGASAAAAMGTDRDGVYLGAAISLALVLVAASLVLHGWTRDDARLATRALAREDHVSLGWHAGYGVLGGALVCLPAMSVTGERAGSVVLIPLIWSMGVAEWQIVRFRARAFERLNEAISMPLFRIEVLRAARASVAGYLLALGSLSALAGVVGPRLGSNGGLNLAMGLLAGWLLGAGFYLALVVASMGGVRQVVLGMAVAVAAGLGGLIADVDLTVLLAPPTVFLCLLVRPFIVTVTDPTRHM